MGIRFEDLDDDTLTIVRGALQGDIARQALAELEARSPDGAARGLENRDGTTRGELSAAAPHPVLFLGLDELRAGRGLAQARRVAKRVLVRESGRSLAAVHVASSSDVRGDDARATVHVGPFVGDTERAFERLADELGDSAEPATLALVEVPSLQVTAVIACDARGAPTRAIPLRPTPAWLTPGVPIAADEFERRLVERARDILPFDASPRPAREDHGTLGEPEAVQSAQGEVRVESVGAPAVVPLVRDLHVLLIGIDAYVERNALHGCVNDVDAIQRLLVDRLGVDRGRITRIVSPHPNDVHEADVPSLPATRANIVRALTELGTERVAPGERVFLYYAGHGASVLVIDGAIRTRREALIPVDARLEDGELAGLLYDVELNGLLQRIGRRAAHATFVLDCCHSSGATRAALLGPGDAVRSIKVEKTVPLAALGLTSETDDAEARSVERGVSGVAGDALAKWQVVAACLSDESAFECTDADGRKHGLLSRSLLSALGTLPLSELARLTWGHIWRGVAAEIERRKPQQHPTLHGSFARPLFGGPSRAGDAGYGVTRDGTAYRLDVGELAGVTTGAKVAVYGPEPTDFPPLDSVDDLRVRVGVLRVVRASRSSARAEPDGAAFELPRGARARLVEAGVSARLVVAASPRDAAIEARINASPMLRTPADGESAAVTLARCANGDLALTDALHGTGDRADEPYLVRIPPRREDRMVAVLEHYVRYTAPVRMAEACTDLSGELSLQLLDCIGPELDEQGRLVAVDAQNPALPELLPGPDGVYEFVNEDRICMRVVNRSKERLRVALFDCAPEGCVALLGEEVLGPGASHVFWRNHELGNPFYTTVRDERSVSFDRMVVLGTSVMGTSFKHLEVAEEDSFERILEGRGVGASRTRYAPSERWTSARVTLRTRQ